jgi:hypothetical protein
MSVDRLVASREIALSQINGSVDRADASYAAASVTASAAIASAIVYLADVILFCFTPLVEIQEERAE